MCTSIVKFRGDKVLRLVGVPCCLPVEAVEDVAPKFSRANGWQELCFWGPPGGMSEIEVSLDDEAACRLRGTRPAGALEYRGRRVCFEDRERVEAARDYVAARVRRAGDFPAHRGFLENLPAEFLKASARGRVVVLLERLIARIEAEASQETLS